MHLKDKSFKLRTTLYYTDNNKLSRYNMIFCRIIKFQALVFRNKVMNYKILLKLILKKTCCILSVNNLFKMIIWLTKKKRLVIKLTTTLKKL